MYKCIALGCRNVSRNRTHDEFVRLLADKNPMIEILGEYVSSKTLVRCRCRVCAYEWDGNPSNLLNGHICRKCARKKAAEKRHLTAVGNNNFAINFPHLLNEWDYERNGDQQPEQLSASCDFEAKWLCPFGHRYSAKVCDRTKKKPLNCPVCNNRNLTSFPEQAIYFYITKCFPQAINRYKKGFDKQELDIYIPALNIGIEYDGRVWHKNAIEREMKKYQKCQELGITLIRVREAIFEENLSAICDSYVRSDYAVDGFLGLDRAIEELLSMLRVSVDINSQRDAFVIKRQYYTILRRGSFAELFPKLVAEWDCDANGDLIPGMFSSGSQDVVHWICPRGHKYKAKIADRAYGSGCAKCAGIKRKTTAEFCEEMSVKHPDILVLGKYVNNKTGILCRCLKCAHEWSPIPNDVLRSHGCPNCANVHRALYKREYHSRKRDEKKEDS